MSAQVVTFTVNYIMAIKLKHNFVSFCYNLRNKHPI